MFEFVWIAIAVIMAVVEGLSQTLITVWFFAGALIAAFSVSLGLDLTGQIIVFIAVSVVCMLLFRPALKRYLTQKYEEKSSPVGRGEATPLGQLATVVEAIDNASGKGRVETPDHMSWVALSANGQPIAQGANVRVVDVQSVKLVVEEIGNEQPVVAGAAGGMEATLQGNIGSGPTATVEQGTE